VLVVDDNVDSADTLGRLLQLDGHQIQIAYEGAAALGLRIEALAVHLVSAGFDRPEDYWPKRWAEAYVAFTAGVGSHHSAEQVDAKLLGCLGKELLSDPRV
jgi:hypothetical protein